MTTYAYQVIDLETGESHGLYESLCQARGCVQFDRLIAYQIWRGYEDSDGEFFGQDRVENCEPYEGDDERVKLALGQPCMSERIL